MALTCSQLLLLLSHGICCYESATVEHLKSGEWSNMIVWYSIQCISASASEIRTQNLNQHRVIKYRSSLSALCPATSRHVDASRDPSRWLTSTMCCMIVGSCGGQYATLSHSTPRVRMHVLYDGTNWHHLRPPTLWTQLIENLHVVYAWEVARATMHTYG